MGAAARIVRRLSSLHYHVTHSGSPRMAWSRTTWISLGVILALALVVRGGAAWWWQARLPADQRYAFPDSDGYWELARTIDRGQDYQYEGYRVFRTPGYPALLAGLFCITGDNVSPLAARMLGAVVGTIGVGLTAGLAGRLFGETAAIVAAGIAAFEPGTIAMSILLLSEGTFTTLMIGQLWLWIEAMNPECWKHRATLGLVSGIIAALACLVRPSYLLFPLFVLGLMLLASPQRLRHLGVGLAICAGFALGMSPWWARNYEVTGEFIPTSLQVGASLYDGWNPAADGSSRMDFVRDYRAEQKQIDARENSPPELYERRLDRRMRDDSIAWAQSHPLEVIQLAGVKFLRIWSPWANEGGLRSWPLVVFSFVTYVPLLTLAIGGIWQWGRRGWPYTLLLMPALYFTLLHMIFVASLRYRLPAMVPLEILAAGFIVGWWWGPEATETATLLSSGAACESEPSSRRAEPS